MCRGFLSVAALFIATSHFSSAAKGDTVLLQFISTPTQIASGIFSYSASLSASNSTSTELQTDDFFTILDFGPVISLVSAPPGWQMSEALVGPDGPFQAPPDNPGILNVTFTNTAPTIGPTTTSIALGTFTLHSAGTAAVEGYYTAQDHEYDNVINGYEASGNSSSTGVPVPGFGGSPVPVPASFWGGAALMGLLASAKLLRRSPAV
jgi:hypothetical protein